MSRYYLVASLPSLALGTPPPLSLTDFVERCREQLPPPDVAALRALIETGGESGRHPFLRAWRGREVRLRNAVARARAARMGKDPEPYLRPDPEFDGETEGAVAAAFGRATPLDREWELDRFRWKAADRLAGLDPFSASAVFAYALKLRMVERWAALDPEAGRRHVDALVRRPA